MGINWGRNLGMRVLAIWLIFTGLQLLLPHAFVGAQLQLISGALAIAAGVLLLLER